MKLSEAHISAQVRSFLEHHGWRVIRNQRAIIPGAFQSGEPGMTDLLAIRYPESKVYGAALVLWIEVKRPEDRRACICRQNLGTRKRCGVCDQANFQKHERARGAQVWTVREFEAFAKTYEERFGWLHTGAVAGQVEMFIGSGK